MVWFECVILSNCGCGEEKYWKKKKMFNILNFKKKAKIAKRKSLIRRTFDSLWIQMANEPITWQQEIGKTLPRVMNLGSRLVAGSVGVTLAGRLSRPFCSGRAWFEHECCCWPRPSSPDGYLQRDNSPCSIISKCCPEHHSQFNVQCPPSPGHHSSIQQSTSGSWWNGSVLTTATTNSL